jgi:hypothetical protein
MLPEMCTQSPNNANIHHAITPWDRGGLVVEDFRENKKILFELFGTKCRASIRSPRPDSPGRTRTGCSLNESDGSWHAYTQKAVNTSKNRM